MSNGLFAAALGVKTPWYVKDVKFDAGKKLLTVAIDFANAGGTMGLSRRKARRRYVPAPYTGNGGNGRLGAGKGTTLPSARYYGKKYNPPKAARDTRFG